MNKLSEILPADVIDRIIPFTYRPQHPDLCNDIHSYYTIIREARARYAELYPSDIPFVPGCEADEWLSNDICIFLNNSMPTMYGYKDLYIDVYRRPFMNKTKDVDSMPVYIDKIEPELFPRDIKIVIGLLRPDEREQLIKFLR
jgi:hypothetical protein